MLEVNNIYHGDCLDLMPQIIDKSIDCIICDLPFGVTRNPWDSVIPFDKLWESYDRVAKPNAAIILFAQDKFTAKLMLSNEKYHRYNLIWKKGERTSGFLNAKRMPLRNHEDICVFYKKLPTYNPQMSLGGKSHSRGSGNLNKNNNYGDMVGMVGDTKNGNMKYPKSILNFERPHPPIHPTQKPVTLCEYLIKTYTNEGDVVLDNCMGVATTCIAAKNTNRRFIGIEKEEKYFNIAKERIYA